MTEMILMNLSFKNPYSFLVFGRIKGTIKSINCFSFFCMVKTRCRLFIFKVVRKISGIKSKQINEFDSLACSFPCYLICVVCFNAFVCDFLRYIHISEKSLIKIQLQKGSLKNELTPLWLLNATNSIPNEWFFYQSYIYQVL